MNSQDMLYALIMLNLHTNPFNIVSWPWNKTRNDIDQLKSPQPKELGCYRSSTTVGFIKFH